ncbi:putative aspartic peptidase A1 family [Rosa chinensis]|uniref:Putative aspartic peptidase A1 family n=1 Tax=Rosa chinensis TaxID=74649 RepID=A0A2P6RUQ1_ROSCH|nr:putative aspartic peptidase A1 family [Rosa chinensis]
MIILPSIQLKIYQPLPLCLLSLRTSIPSLSVFFNSGFLPLQLYLSLSLYFLSLDLTYSELFHSESPWRLTDLSSFSFPYSPPSSSVMRWRSLSSRLIHRFSDEAKVLKASRSTGDAKWLGLWPRRNSMDYYHLLVNTDFQRQKMKLAAAASPRHHQFQFLFPSEGSNTASFGNYFGLSVSPCSFCLFLL